MSLDYSFRSSTALSLREGGSPFFTTYVTVPRCRKVSCIRIPAGRLVDVVGKRNFGAVFAQYQGTKDGPRHRTPSGLGWSDCDVTLRQPSYRLLFELAYSQHCGKAPGSFPVNCYSSRSHTFVKSSERMPPWQLFAISVIISCQVN